MPRRIAVAATAPFGADVLERLAAEHEVVQLLTRPDKPRGRGRRLGPSPAKEVAQRLGIPHEQPARLDSSVGIAAHVVVVCAYGLLIPDVLLERAVWLNVHPSLLPRWRGAAPVERAVMAGDDETGVTIHRTVEALDASPIAAQRSFPIAPDDDAGAVYARSAEVAAELLRDVLAQDEPHVEPQPEQGVTYAEKIRPGDRELDGLAQGQPLILTDPSDRLGSLRQRPGPPVRLAYRDERRGGGETLERRHEAAEDKGRSKAERNVVPSDLERRRIGLDELDPFLEPGGSDSLARRCDELRRALDAGEPAAEPLGEQDGRPAATGGNVEHVRVRPEAQALAEQDDLLRTRRVLQLVLRLDDGVPPGHLRPRRYAS